MFKKRLSVLLLSVLTLMIFFDNTWAMDAKQTQLFDQILKMDVPELTVAAEELLDQKYPDEDWDKHGFPSFVFTNDSVEAGYKIAVKMPLLLGKTNVSGKETVLPCYCFCDAKGHKNLLYCFWENGIPDGNFDEHASSCNVCYSQALLAFLWDNLGATHNEIIAGLESRFSHLAEKREKAEG